MVQMTEEQILEAKIAILYFIEEACGYRHSLHWLRRWMESGQQSDLEHLIIEIGRENFYDFKRLIQATQGDNDARWEMMSILTQRGIIVPDEWKPVREEEGSLLEQDIVLTSAPEAMIHSMQFGEQDFNTAIGNTWNVFNWIQENKKNYPELDPIGILAYAMEKLYNSQSNVYEVCYFIRMLLGKGTLIENTINEDLELFAKNVGNYFADQEWVTKNLMLAIQNGPEENWKDALSRNQVKSKIWLLDKLESTGWFTQKPTVTKENPTMVLVGGWVGLLPFIAAVRNQKLGAVINVDIDESTHLPAKVLNGQHYTEFRNLAKDIRTLDFNKFKNFVIVDTIVEHFENHAEWIQSLPAGTKLILQGNDMFDVPDHVNCHHNLDEFVDTCGLAKVIWQGELTLPGCTRFMVIGTT
jgi:hypothetical protein